MDLAERPRVSVVGGSRASGAVLERAEALGAALADLGVVLVNGGLGGTMAAAGKGYRGADGPLYVGILPGRDRASANRYVELAVETGLGHARNALVALNGDVVVALPGGSGTLSEVGLGGVFERPVVGVDAWHDLDRVETVPDVDAAVEAVARHVER